MEVTQTKRLGKGKPNSLFTFQRENFWTQEQERREKPKRKTLAQIPRNRKRKEGRNFKTFIPEK